MILHLFTDLPVWYYDVYNYNILFTDLPVFVMIISVPSSLNLSHRSLVSSRQLTCCSSSELHRSSSTGSDDAVVAPIDGGGGLDVDDDMTISSAGEARDDRTVTIVSLLRRLFLSGFPSAKAGTRNETKKLIIFIFSFTAHAKRTYTRILFFVLYRCPPGSRPS